MYVETRWCCIYDIAAWIVDHFLLIDSFLHDPIVKTIDDLNDDLSIITKTLYIEAPLVVVLFAPFRTCSKLFETDLTPMSSVFPLTTSAIALGRKIASFSTFTINVYTVIESAITRRILHSNAGLMLYLMFLVTTKGREFDASCIRGWQTVDKSLIETFCTSNFEIKCDETLLKQAKTMLNDHSVFHEKYKMLCDLHSKPDLFSPQETDSEAEIRKFKENQLSLFKDKLERLRENSSKWTQVSINNLQKELNDHTRITLAINSSNGAKATLHGCNDVDVCPLSQTPLNETEYPQESSQPFTQNNDFISVTTELPKEEEQILIKNGEIRAMFVNRELWSQPHRYNPSLWKGKNKSIDELLRTPSNEEEEDFIENYEKLNSYFDDFELEEDLVDSVIEFNEENLLSKIEQISQLYHLDNDLIQKFFIYNWRSSDWDSSFNRLIPAPNNFAFWKHINEARSSSPEQFEFSKLALRLVSISASEASVERIFSQKRPISTGAFANASNQLNQARLTIKWFSSKE